MDKPDILKADRFSQVLKISTETLIPHPKNPRSRPEEQIPLLKAGILHFGFTNPILVQKSTNFIVAGHGRQLAALELNLPEVPIIYWDISDEEAEAHMIADNKIGMMSTWNEEILRSWMEEKQKSKVVELSGFSRDEINYIVQTNFDPDPKGAAGQAKLDALVPIMVKCPECEWEFNSREHYAPKAQD